jgi:hypothetical protein
MSARYRELQAIADGDAPEQLELSPIFQEVRERYADCVRLVAIELSRAQVDALANMARAHQAGDFFYSRAQEGFEVLEIIVRSWVTSVTATGGQHTSSSRHRAVSARLESAGMQVPEKPQQPRSVTERLKEVERLILLGSKATPATASRIAPTLGISRKQFYRDVALLRQAKKEIVYDARAYTYRIRPQERAPMMRAGADARSPRTQRVAQKERRVAI